MKKNDASNGETLRSGCLRVPLRLAIVLGLGLLVFGITSYETVGELITKWTTSDEEAARQQAERDEAAAYARLRSRKLKEMKEEEAERDRQWEEEQAARERERQHVIRVWRAEELLRERRSASEERAKQQALERALTEIEGIASLEDLDRIVQDAQGRMANSLHRPMEPLVLYILVATAIKAGRAYLKDKIFGNPLQELIMKELVHESTIMGDDLPEEENRLLLEKIAAAVQDWARSAAK